MPEVEKWAFLRIHNKVSPDSTVFSRP